MGRDGPNVLRLASLALLLGAVVLFFVELIAFSRQRARLPEGLTIAGVPVGRLDQTEALQRLLQTYSTPLELYYGDQLIVVPPSRVGYQLDAEAMMAAGELARTRSDFWPSFWDYLWSRPGEPQSIPVRAEYSQAQLQAVLADIAARYDLPARSSQPIPGSPDFEPGSLGRVLDQGRAAELVSEVLNAPANRRVILPVAASEPARPGLQTLETLLKQNLDVAEFDGMAVIYMQDLRTGEVMHFGYFHNQDLNVQPDVAFDAASTIKIAIATAYFRYYDLPLDEESERWLAQMITQSGNDPANWLMEEMDFSRGPMMVTDTLFDLGLDSSYIVAWFENPRRFSTLEQLIVAAPPATPANRRIDVNTRPNTLNQTTASDLGNLLADLYACGSGGGALLAAFPDEINPAECRQVLDLLAQNKIAWLLEASVPDGTRVAHKHGWTQSPLDFISDAGIIYSPGGDYVLSIFLWNEREMIWEPTSRLFAQLGRAVYNYFNPPTS